MINSISIENFKCFSHVRLQLGALTLLSGFNGSGKSTSLQPLLLLAQAFRSTPAPSEFFLNGQLIQLGTTGDIVPNDLTDAPISFGIESSSGSAAWQFRPRPGERVLRQTSITPLPQSVEELLQRITYVSAVREGTADVYPMPSSTRTRDVGVHGRFAPFWYEQCADDVVDERRRHPNESAPNLRRQLDAWMNELFPGSSVNVQGLPHLSLLSLQFRLSELGEWRRPANVGYGLTYAFPILVALLTAVEGQVVVIDSPEAHLHPFAQSQMGRLIAKFASTGLQVIVESHSDHLLNGARLAVRAGLISFKDMQLHFFTGTKKGAHGVISPAVDRQGRINDWPEGFFDQSEKDLSELGGWA